MKKLIQKGFTLLELLVAMSVTVIIVGLLTYVVRTSFNTLNDSQGTISSNQKAVLAIDQLAIDLESMFVKSGSPYEWLAASAMNTNPGSEYSNLFDTAGSSSNAVGNFSRLAFITAAVDRYDGDLENPGDISCVEYGIAYQDIVDPDEGTNPTFVLFRNRIEPDVTFTSVIADSTVDATTYDLLTTVDSTRASAPAGRPTRFDDPANILSENVKALSITFNVEYTDAAGLTQLAKIPVVETGTAATDGFKVDRFAVTGTGLRIDTHGTSSIPNVAQIIANGRIASIAINADIIDPESVPLLNVSTSSTALTEQIEQAVTKYSKTLFIPQL